MVRTQIYLTEEQQKALRQLALRRREKQSELIRQAIDRFLADSTQEDHLSLLRQGRGLWKDRQDLPDFAALRREANREQRG